MNESFVANHRNVINKSRKTSINDKSKHRLSDQKWRQNVSKGFAALKTIVKQNKKQSLDQLMASEGTKDVSIDKKKPSVANKRLSRIETLKSTIDLIETKEAVIENLINERQQELNEISNKPMIAFNGLQKIKDIFIAFERRHESEAKEMTSRQSKDENILIEMTSNEDNNCLPQNSNSKTFDPFLRSLELKAIKTEDSISSEDDINSLFENDDWKPLVWTDTESDPCLDFKDIDLNYGLNFDEESDHNLDSYLDDFSLFDSFSSIDDKPFGDLSYDLNPKEYLTTDLAIELGFSPSIDYLNEQVFNN